MRDLAAAPILALLAAFPMTAQSFSALRTVEDGVEIVRLEDPAANSRVSIAPRVGNIAYEYRVNGKNAFWHPFDSPGAFAAKPALSGNPLLWPWANRLDRDGFFANGRYYALREEMGNLRRDGNRLPIHGLLLFSDAWEVVELAADGAAAWATSRLELSRHPALAAQFPFASAIEMTYRLRRGELEVETRVTNRSTEPMPLSLGYHPYFQIHDAPRDEWRVRLAARSLWTLSEKLTPTGATEPIETRFPERERLPLAGVTLDTVFGDLVREAGGWARFSVEGKREKIEVLYGEKFDTAVVYAPPGAGREYICFEPMAGITNAFNLAHEGKFAAMQSVPPGGEWRERFVVRVSGF